MRLDPSLGPVAQASPPGALGLAEAVVARPRVAGAAPFLLEGERMAVTGSERLGAHAFWWGARLVAEGLATNAGHGVNVVASPASLRRELLGPHGTLLELTLVAPTLPLAAVQWHAPPGGRWPGPLELSLVVLPGCDQVRCHVQGEGVRCVADVGDGEAAVEVRVHPSPVEWRAGGAPGGGVRVHALLPREGPATLVVTAGSRDAASRAMEAAPHLSAHETRAAADADPAAQETLTTLTGVPGLDHGVVWATFRMRSSLLRSASGPAEGVFWAGLGAVAVGDAPAGAAALGALWRHGSDAVPWRLGGSVPAPALATLLAARLTLLNGEAGPALHALRLLGPGSPGSLIAAADPEARILWGHALASLADSLRYAAPLSDVQALRAAAAMTGAEGAGLKLPMVGAPRAIGGAAELRRLLGREGGSPGVGSPDTPLGAWALWGSLGPDAAWPAWRALLARGLEGGPAGRGTWDGPRLPPAAAPEAGLLLCGLAYGLLGLDPDAPSGRLRLAPRLPSHLSALLARRIRVGESEIEVRYEREGTLHTLRLEPTRGRVPATVVLEPSLRAGALTAAWVDGVPADLDTSATGSRVRFRVQLSLDAPRTVEVEAEPPPQG